MHIASQIGGQLLNMRQFQIMSLMPHPQIGPFYEEIWLASVEQIFEHFKRLLLIIK